MEPDALTKLLDERPVPFNIIMSTVAEAANKANPQDFSAVLNLARSDEDYCWEAELPAVAALPAWGKHGIAELKKMVESGPHDRAAFSTLLSIAIGKQPSRLVEIWHFFEKNGMNYASMSLRTSQLKRLEK